jgi:hypothetical protein
MSLASLAVLLKQVTNSMEAAKKENELTNEEEKNRTNIS